MKPRLCLTVAASLLLLGACASGPEPAPQPVAAPDLAAAPIDPAGGRWKLVSCHVDGRGCRDEDIYRSEEGCLRASRELERDDRDRRAACRKLAQ
ncbi:hypothetical protein [Arenimonas sp. MALMAid1274]|uniref:hypothetical protein n=1 Tax=Arenimonas sp. MALMAid1274 TaxID=3411630 RepID=UPI003BA35127